MDIGYICLQENETEEEYLDKFKFYKIEKWFFVKQNEESKIKSLEGFIRDYDTIYTNDFCKMVRNTEDSLRILNILKSKKSIRLINLENNLVQLNNPMGFLILNLVGTVNEMAEKKEKERREEISKLTSEGMKQAKLNGKRIGNEKGVKLTTKKSVEMKEKIFEFSKDFCGEHKDEDLIKMLDIARNTFYKYKREIKKSILDNSQDSKKYFIKKYSRDFEGKQKDISLIKALKISETTFYRYKREMKEGK